MDSGTSRLRGRRRSADRDDVILEAARSLMTEIGVDRLRVQHVAARAGVGLATIYRRWPSKQELIVAALASGRAPLPPLTGNARADLLRTLRGFVAQLGDGDAKAVTGSLAAMNADAGVAAAVRVHAFEPVREHFRRCIAQAGGDLDEATLSMRADMAPALLFLRVVLAGETVSDRDVEQLVDLMLEGTDAGRC